MYEPGDIFAGAAMTREELSALDKMMYEALQVGSTVWEATFRTGGLFADVVGVRRDVNAVFPWGGAA
jgi:hypothetical protein